MRPAFDTPGPLMSGPPPCVYAYMLGASCRSSRFHVGGSGYLGSLAGGGVGLTAAPCAAGLARSASAAAAPTTAPAPVRIASRRLNLLCIRVTSSACEFYADRAV